MLSCDNYDYIEIACLYHLDIELHFDANSVRGIAEDTKRNAEGEEGILLKTPTTGELKWFPINSLLGLTAHTENRHFTHLDFSH